MQDRNEVPMAGGASIRALVQDEAALKRRIEANHSAYQLPADLDLPIRRFMKVADLVWMLAFRRLVLVSLVQFADGDPHEGRFIASDFSEFDDHTRRVLVRDNADHIETTYISCWHMGDVPAEAMWRIYAPRDLGVCVRSTPRRLLMQLPPTVNVGMVKYTNERTIGGMVHMAMRKRECFRFESELRACCVFRDLNSWNRSARRENGLRFPIDPAELACGIEVSPKSKPYFLEAVQAVCDRFGLPVKVSRSTLDTEPLS